jgi:hypothetical protein
VGVTKYIGPAHWWNTTEAVDGTTTTVIGAMASILWGGTIHAKIAVNFIAIV